MEDITRNSVRIMIGARKKLNDGDWIQRSSAKDRSGNSCDIKSDDAVQFCLLGAITKAYNELGGTPNIKNLVKANEEIVKTIEDVSGRTCIPVFNDCVAEEKQDIINVLDSTINRINSEDVARQEIVESLESISGEFKRWINPSDQQQNVKRKIVVTKGE